MKKFEGLDKRSVHEVETDILNNWKKVNILEKTIENRKDKENYVFYDGPIYANAKPGIHHVMAKTIKDSFCNTVLFFESRLINIYGDIQNSPIVIFHLTPCCLFTVLKILSKFTSKIGRLFFS